MAAQGRGGTGSQMNRGGSALHTTEVRAPHDRSIRFRGKRKLKVIPFACGDYQIIKPLRETQGQGHEKQHQGPEERIP